MKWLMRIENLLVLLPFVLLAISLYILFGSNFFAEKELRLQIFVNIFLQSTMQLLFVLLPGYLMHYFLRVIKRRNKLIAVIHVIISAALIIFTSGVDSISTSVVPGWHTAIWAPASFGFLTGMPPWAGVLFWLTQLLFLAYGIFIIHGWRNPRA